MSFEFLTSNLPFLSPFLLAGCVCAAILCVMVRTVRPDLYVESQQRLPDDPLVHDYEIITEAAKQLRTHNPSPSVAILEARLMDAIMRNGGDWVGVYGVQEIMKLLSDGTLPRERLRLLGACGERLVREAIDTADGNLCDAIATGCKAGRPAAIALRIWREGGIDVNQLVTVDASSHQ